MNPITCDVVQDLACELALDVLGAEERAAACSHLETCAACRQEVALLADAADGLLVLAPSVEPSAGFEQRVLAQIDVLAKGGASAVVPLRTRRRRTSYRVRVVAALVAAFAVAGFLATAWPTSEDVPTRSAPVRTSAGDVVGNVSISDDPASVVLTIPDWAGLVHSYQATVDAPYWIDVEASDGSRDLVRLPTEEHPWTVPVDVDPSLISTVSLVDNTGIVWCTAEMPS